MWWDEAIDNQFEEEKISLYKFIFFFFSQMRIENR